MKDAKKLDYLLNRYFDGGLAEAEHGSLEKLLLSSEEARGQFWWQAEFHSVLCQQAKAKSLIRPLKDANLGNEEKTCQTTERPEAAGSPLSILPESARDTADGQLQLF